MCKYLKSPQMIHNSNAARMQHCNYCEQLLSTTGLLHNYWQNYTIISGVLYFTKINY